MTDSQNANKKVLLEFFVLKFPLGFYLNLLYIVRTSKVFILAYNTKRLIVHLVLTVVIRFMFSGER